MNVDKAQVRDDYIRGFSVRMLAAKYDVPKSTIGRWVKQFGWVQEAGAAQEERIRRKKEEWDTPRDKERDNGTWDVPPLPVADDYNKMRIYTDKLLAKADVMLDLDDKLSPKDLKSLSGMLLDVRTLLNILSPREAAEQEMRLAALRKQAEDEDKTQEPVVVEFVNREWEDPSASRGPHQSAALTASPCAGKPEGGAYAET